MRREMRNPQASREEGEMRDPQAALAEKQRSLEWKCLTCGITALATPGAYMGLIQHSCTGKRKIWLVDRDTGEQLANNAKQALQMGLIEKSTKPTERTERKPKGDRAEEDREGGELTEPFITSEGIFKYTIALPSDAFTLFNLAKFSGLEKDSDKPFDEWIWECITARYRYDYEMQVVLAPIPEEQKRG